MPLATKCKRLLHAFLVMAIIVIIGMYLTPQEAIKGYWYVNPVTRFPDFIVGMLLFQLYEYLRKKDFTMLQGSVMEVTAIIIFMLFYLYASEVPKVYRTLATIGCQYPCCLSASPYRRASSQNCWTIAS